MFEIEKNNVAAKLNRIRHRSALIFRFETLEQPLHEPSSKRPFDLTS